jgi:hypothetical protein
MDRDGDFGFWTTLVDAVVIVAFAIRYRAEIVPLLPVHVRSQRAQEAGDCGGSPVRSRSRRLLSSRDGRLPFERITDEIERHDYSLWQLLALYSLAPALSKRSRFVRHLRTPSR